MRVLFLFAAFSGAIGVILGAFAAHGLKGRLTESLLSAFQTGVQYQLYHSLAILALVIMHRVWPNYWLFWAACAMALGVVFFSGSLYALALTEIKWFGPITPLGGLCFIVGWLAVAIAAFQYE